MREQWSEKNRAALQRGFPELYERFIHRESQRDREVFSSVYGRETLAGNEALVVETRDGRRIRLNSAYDPDTEARIWLRGQESTDAANIFMFGLGTGAFARAVLGEKGEKSRVLIYEPSLQIFLYAMEHYDMTAFFQTQGVRVLVEGLNEEMYSGVMEEMLTLENFEDRSFLVLPHMEALFPASRKRFVQRYIDGVGVLMANRNAIRLFLHLSPYNQLHNLKYLPDNTVVPRLAKVWPGEVPVVVVGAGPSLKDDIETLRKVRDKVFVFAVDSALPYLMEHEVIPDAFDCIEADKPMRFFTDPRVYDIPLFARVHTTHKLLDRHRGKKIFGYEDGFMETVYQQNQVPLSRFRYGGNGATTFFAICQELGVRTLILAGQDMAYSSDRQTHVGGRDEGYIIEERFQCESNSGEKVWSRQDWYRFARWYENAIPACQFDHVVNVAASGVKIRGTEYMPLKEAVARFGRDHEDISAVLERAETTFARRGFQRVSCYKQFLQEIEKIARIVEQDPGSEKRKQYLVYKLLELYEIADKQEDFAASQREGIRLIKKYIRQCMEED